MVITAHGLPLQRGPGASCRTIRRKVQPAILRLRNGSFTGLCDGVGMVAEPSWTERGFSRRRMLAGGAAACLLALSPVNSRAGGPEGRGAPRMKLGGPELGAAVQAAWADDPAMRSAIVR